MSSPWILTCEQVRQIDRAAIDDLQMPGLVLMENAGRGLVDLICRAGTPRRVLIACGPGNNGGDGYVMARHLDLRGVEVHVALASDPARLSGDARDNFRWLEQTHVRVHRADAKWPRLDDRTNKFDWVVDALLGTGTRGAPRAPLDMIIRQLNRGPARRLAVDIPSGLNGDTGEAAEPTFRADVTGTFVAAKPGLLAARAAAYVGQVEVVDIGVPRLMLERLGRPAEL